MRSFTIARDGFRAALFRFERGLADLATTNKAAAHYLQVAVTCEADDEINDDTFLDAISEVTTYLRG